MRKLGPATTTGRFALEGRLGKRRRAFTVRSLARPAWPACPRCAAPVSAQGDAAARRPDCEVVCGKALARWPGRWHGSCWTTGAPEDFCSNKEGAVNRFRKLFLLATAALVLPASASAQAAGRVSWGWAENHGPGWDSYASTPRLSLAYANHDHGWSLGADLWAVHGPHCGHGLRRWGPIDGGWRTGPGFGGCWGHALPCVHDFHFGPGWWRGHACGHGHMAWLDRRQPPLGPPTWVAWPYAAFAYHPWFFHAPGYFWGGPEPLTWSGWELGGFRRSGHVVADRGYRTPPRSRLDDRAWRDRPVRRSPLFGPRYKEDPRAYVTDNGPERPTSRAVPRSRDGDWVAPGAPGRTGPQRDPVRKAKPRSQAGSGVREPSRATTGASARPARPAARPGARPLPTPRTRPTERARPAPRPDQRRPAARATPPRKAVAKPRPPQRSAPPAAKPRPPRRSAPPVAKPAPRRPAPTAKPAPARRPPPKRPAKRGK